MENQIIKITKISFLTGFLLVIVFVSMARTSIAQEVGPAPGGREVGPAPGNVSFQITIPNPLKNNTRDLPSLIELIISSVILPIGATIVTIMIIYAGFLFVTARGNETKLETAKKAFLYAVIGAVILLGARVLAAAIQGTVTQLGG
jgi:hypothetical protein